MKPTRTLLTDSSYSPLEFYDFTKPSLFEAAMNESTKHISVKRHLDTSKLPFNEDMSKQALSDATHDGPALLKALEEKYPSVFVG